MQYRNRTATADRVTSNYRKTVLSNGVRIVSEEIPFVRSVSVGLWVDSGSRDEPAALNGISHFLEHMVFKGTDRRSITDIARSLESVGGYLNAFTGKEHTCYYARALDEHLPLALDVTADLLLHATFPAKELEKEKGVVIEELRNVEDDPDDLIHDITEREVFGRHPLGMPVIGTERTVRAFSRNDLTAHREQIYTPDRIVVAAAGRLKHDELVRLVERSLGGLKASRRPARRAKPQRQRGREVRQSKPIQQAHLCLGTVGYSVHQRQRFPMLVMNTLLGDGMSSRLFQSIRERRGFAYTVYSYANTMTDTGTFGVYAGLDATNVERVRDLVWSEFTSLRTKPVPAAELRRTKDQLKGSMMLNLESIPNRMMRLGGSELSLGRLPSLEAVLESIDAVTAADIQRVAESLFRPERFATVILEPSGSAPKERP
ncbi:MAG: insulinase family protein [Bacteroidetes bacterium]|jgi:predicted Zn-dependent peptidase|nr:insulinase family protein [Bacteroidota bacterium]